MAKYVRQEVNSPVLTAREVAEWLSVNICTVYDMCEDGKLPYWRIGAGGPKGDLRFNRESIDAWMREREKVKP